MKTVSANVNASDRGFLGLCWGSRKLSHVKIKHTKFFTQIQMVLGVVGACGVGVNPPVGLDIKIAAVIVVTLIPTAKEMFVQGSIGNLPAAKILAVSCEWQLLYSLFMH